MRVLGGVHNIINFNSVPLLKMILHLSNFKEIDLYILELAVGVRDILQICSPSESDLYLSNLKNVDLVKLKISYFVTSGMQRLEVSVILF